MSGKRKRSYRRSTPVGRLRRNVAKVARHASLALARMESWRNGKSDPRIEESKVAVREVLGRVADLDRRLESLEESGYVPPRRSDCYRPYVGQPVAVCPRHAAKYRQAFADVLKKDPGLLGNLVVSSVLATGEVVVQGSEHVKFLAAKSHLTPLREGHVRRER